MGKRSKNIYLDIDTSEYKPAFYMTADDMLLSPAYMSLSDGAVRLLNLIKILRKYSRKDPPNGDELNFYCNKAVREMYGWKDPNKFYRCLAELIRWGFVEVVEIGKTTRTKNIYRYSSQWQRTIKGHDVILSNTSRNYLERLEKTIEQQRQRDKARHKK